MLPSALAYARAHRARTVRALQAFVRIPSVAADPARAGDVRRCAGWLAAHLRRAGLRDASVAETGGHPAVLASWRGAPGRPTLLVYGHYDVQPADPLGEWRTPPFAAALRGGAVHGRGACDDKGQLFAHVAAIGAYLGAAGRLPVNVVCLFEGEEEVGSPNLPALLARRRAELAADVAVASDMPMLGRGRPALTAALRGAVAFELEVAGPARDLHSGVFGGAVHNPLQVLCELVAGLHDRDGRVAVPGFYARVRAPAPAERARWRRDGPHDAGVLAAAGVRAGWGERGYDAYERATLRPALTVNGVTGGYQGPGGKGVIPARASAKLSARLVPGQEPNEVARLVAAHLARAAPPTVRVRLRASAGARPATVDLAHPAIAAAAAALGRAFGRAPGLVRSGGTIPVVDLLQRELGAPVLLMGFALPDDGMHGPNERFQLEQLFAGTHAAIALLDELAKRVAPRAAARPATVHHRVPTRAAPGAAAPAGAAP